MDRQPLTDRLGDRLLAEYGGAAAAYSLRALNGNGDSVVRVRRASDNDEKDFTASQVSSGEMVNWVNSQTVPPLDIGVETSEGRIPVPEGGTSIGTPAAAYSLRNLSTTYTGNVVDVRRSVGGTESFTAAEVADGTLTNWVNTDYVKYSSDFTSNDNGWGSFDDVTETGAVDGIGGLDGNLRLAIGSATSQHRAYKTNILPENQKSNFSARVFIPSTNSVVDGLQVLDAVGNTIINATSLTQDQWVTVTANDVTTTNSQLRVNLLDGSSTSFTGNSSDVVYLREITVTQVTSDGLVSKWYDQSGNNNHAVQTTAASQPKIVDGGVLVTGGIEFDGADILNLPSEVGTSLSHAVFAVAQTSTTSSGGGSDYPQLLGDNTSGKGFGFFANGLLDKSAGSDNSLGLFSFTSNTFEKLMSVTSDNSIINAFQDGVASASNPIAESSAINKFDRLGGSEQTGRYFDGTIQEIIIYDSDQSDNRTAIEANIGETYGISGIPAYDNTVDGFVETWYDQSGNGNDATQSVAASQPKIVDAGVLVTGGLDFDGDFLSPSLLLPTVQNSFVTSVVTRRNTSTGYIAQLNRSTDRFYLRGELITVGDPAVNINTTLGNNEQSILSVTATAAGLFTGFKDGTSLGITNYTGNVGGGDSTIGATNTGGTSFDGLIAELIVYDSDQSDNRTAIEGNINAHYDIYA